MSKFNSNYWNTDQLVLNIMERCANHCGHDIQDDDVAEKLYWVCSDLEGWDAEFGSSDAFTYLHDAEYKLLGLEQIRTLIKAPTKNHAASIRKGLDEEPLFMCYFNDKVYIRDGDATLIEVINADDEPGLIRKLADKKYKYSNPV
ncbi:MAG: hypothetical protein JXR12_06710 [Neptunomonas phycophila]|uniref:hypothetical protein n=1 Tax=Neptunomonas phycophila TaxID=1572645 RepID=UPI003B8D3C52